MRNLQAAASRFFRFYRGHCEAHDLDTLFNLLNAAHSLNDRLKKDVGEDFYHLDEFIALKALRNFFHHAVELQSEVKLIPISEEMPITSDLPLLCLVPRDLVARAIAEERKDNRPRIERGLKLYGNVANINPAIFNFAVHVFEKVSVLGVPVEGAEWELFADSYNCEERDGHCHFVTGDIACRAGDVEAVIEAICA